MKSYILYIFFLSIPLLAESQKKNKLSIECNYGLNGNFFVRSYDESNGPSNKTNFYNKDFLGTIGGVELKYHLNNSSSLLFSYSRSSNKGEKNYEGNINGVDIYIQYFNIRHTNDFYQVAYERKFKKSNPSLKYHIGFVIANSHQQEISIENFSNQVIIQERDYKHFKLQEGGVFGGLHFTKKIDTKIEAGLKIRVYYLISVSTLEAITLTPTLTYNF